MVQHFKNKVNNCSRVGYENRGQCGMGEVLLAYRG